MCVTQAVTRARVAAMTVASENCAHVSVETPLIHRREWQAGGSQPQPQPKPPLSKGKGRHGRAAVGQDRTGRQAGKPSRAGIIGR